MRFLIPLAIVALGVMIYALVECIQTPRHKVRTFSKGAWIAIILLVPAVGAVLWLVFGHRRNLPAAGGSAGGGFGGFVSDASRRNQPAAPKSPDDDEEFLRNLDIQRAQKAREQELNEREAQLRAREKDLERLDSPNSPDGVDGPKSLGKGTSGARGESTDTTDCNNAEDGEDPQSR